MIPPPWPHQTEALTRSAEAPAFYLSMAMRTGKSRVVLDTARLAYERGAISGLVIIAMPSGAPRQWTEDECPRWFPADFAWKGVTWQANKVGQKSFTTQLEELLTYPPGLAVLTVNGEAIITRNFKAFITRFLKARRCLVAGDEMTLIAKTPGTARTRMMLAIARHPNAVMRRALDGTPMESPLDLYSQYAFLNPRILDCPTFRAFKHRYAEWTPGSNYTTGAKFEVLARNEDGTPKYINLDDLTRRIAPYTFRVLRKDVFNIPDPIFQKHRFELSEKQREIYEQLKETYEAEIASLGTVSAQHVLTRLLRLQQITSNVWPAQQALQFCKPCNEEGGRGLDPNCEICDGVGAYPVKIPAAEIDPDNDPRADALRFELERSPDLPTIIWGRFHHDLDAAETVAMRLGRSPIVKYDGRASPEEKRFAQKAFQSSRNGVIIASQRAAGRALRLDNARLQIFFSNEFSLLARLQAQDRSEMADKTNPTSIVDLIANDTVDEKIVDALRSKRNIADLVLNERSGKWL